MTKRLFKMVVYLNKRQVLLVILLILRRRKAAGQRHVWARTCRIQRRQEFGFFLRFLTEIRINSDKLGFFYFRPYILHLLFHWFFAHNSTKFASLSASHAKEHVFWLVITTAAMLITVIKPCDYRINADWLEWSTKIGTRRTRYDAIFIGQYQTSLVLS